MGPTALRGIRATGDTLSNVESQVFTPYTFGSTAGDRTLDLLTTRPTCYHLATPLHVFDGCLFSSVTCNSAIFRHFLESRLKHTAIAFAMLYLYTCM